MPDNGNILVVEDLSYSYGERRAVRGASFEVHRGEIFGFVGPNGAGKTTTIACLCGLRADWQGKVTFSGRPFQPAQRAKDRQKLGVVPQELALYDGLTGRENLSFFGAISGLKGSSLKEAVERALQLSGLTNRADDRVEKYSGGMKRRLNFVIGDLHQPELLLLDEPTVGVDPQSRSHLFEDRGLARTEATIRGYWKHGRRGDNDGE